MSQSSAGGQETWQGEMLVLCLVAERLRRVAVGAGSLSPCGSRWARGGVQGGTVRLLLGVGTQKLGLPSPAPSPPWPRPHAATCNATWHQLEPLVSQGNTARVNQRPSGGPLPW